MSPAWFAASHGARRRANPNGANDPRHGAVFIGSHKRHDRQQGKQLTVSQEINVLALVKGEERYIFLFDDGNRAETLRTLGRYASDPELSFTWYDAAVLSQKIRQQLEPAPQLKDELIDEFSTEIPELPRFSMPLPSDSIEPDEIW